MSWAVKYIAPRCDSLPGWRRYHQAIWCSFSATRGPTDSTQPTFREGPQWKSTPTGGSWPKVPALPSTAQSWPRPEEPDPVSSPCRWIHAKMIKITHCPWWKELKASSRMVMHSDIISEDLMKPQALHWACWQAAAFWLPLAQQEASGWWDALPRFCGLCRVKFLTHTSVSSPRDFWAVRQEKTLALAWVMQACAKESGFPTGVLC